MTDPAELLGAFAPVVQPPTLPASDVSYVVEDTAIGRMLLARKDSGALVASSFVPDATAEERLLQRLSTRISPRVLRQPNSKALAASIVQTVRAAVENAGEQSRELLAGSLPGDLRAVGDTDMTTFVGSHDADVRLRSEDRE